ncbi:MAG: 16S rRNA (guanine(527)-N(7))-methyltransferase RsmG [Lachnospiraceae bacterium]|jgi:16S rRNA (guanine527-N7)-methyltransferase|nr:16S rRNA (guanine(527)-N(7))-methyltransferase RsmG [Lachnospiraceae bacterium]
MGAGDKKRFGEEEKRLLWEGAGELGIDLSETMVDSFIVYGELIEEWNERVNLTAIREPGEIITKHFCDSLSITRAVDDLGQSTLRIVDIGSGAGFPGIPMGIAFPGLSLVLVDSLQKRVEFLAHAVRELGLSNVTAVHGRAEDLGRSDEFRGRFDLAVSRAVAKLPVLAEYAIPMLKVGGRFVAYKSGESDQEISDSKRAFELLGADLENVVRFTLSGGEIHRSLVVLDKMLPTDPKYPRRAGIPDKKPL